MKLYKYIFSRAYYFCINVFKEEEIAPHYAAGVVSMVLVVSIVVALELFKYLMLPTVINIYGEYHGYFSLIMLTATVFFFNRRKYYRKVLKEYAGFSTKERRALNIWTWIYIGSILFGFFYLGHLLRESYQK